MQIVEEKETRLRELLCIMGLRPSMLLASWAGKCPSLQQVPTHVHFIFC
jgi:hypothetical protein